MRARGTYGAAVTAAVDVVAAPGDGADTVAMGAAATTASTVWGDCWTIFMLEQCRIVYYHREHAVTILLYLFLVWLPVVTGNRTNLIRFFGTVARWWSWPKDSVVCWVVGSIPCCF